MNIKKQLSPTQNTPALQARFTAIVRSDSNVNGTKVTISQLFIFPICFLVSLSSCNIFLQLSVGQQSTDDLVTFNIVSDLTSEESSTTLTSSELVMQF